MQALQTFNLNAQKKTLFIIGGSQGSTAINECVAEMITHLSSIQILWQTGAHNYDTFKHFYSENVKVLPYVNEMPSVYAVADLTLSRAGALTLAELTACGLPCILVPLPTAAANHQQNNAAELVHTGAAISVEQSELNAEYLAKKIISLIHDCGTLTQMSEASLALGKPEATSVIVDHILERINA